jgi:hypothetical protein
MQHGGVIFIQELRYIRHIGRHGGAIYPPSRITISEKGKHASLQIVVIWLGRHSTRLDNFR